MEVSLLAPHEVWSQREHILPLIAKGLERGGGGERVTAEMLVLQAMNGDALVWVCPDMACVATVSEYPTGHRTLVVVSVGGKNSKSWLPSLIAELRRVAKNLGAAEVEFFGRFGWDRVLARYGWRRQSLHMTLEA